ncbi:hypothetical protein DIU31_031660 [Mucilaginibacter rubeus]|uniref:Aspartyl protease family protein n=1 Tax=Mucilaginibacter rubeus TaxID=2027860 RepID=A0AAE6JLU5_9SPHI|nr:aspartyl protease family protein [Mucilaginibacter rubeus]QEM20290.1 hypothetical protein DIU38_031265 [Mucilaginibacter gossypii]QEM07838.1 hypothetical protein DIU31_031660 [Mucilaginibacter rubeus]QTE42992.1 aspartyl protease family protein [Mucilaginibacter rubeus]QTE49593.1 aspartyl protease family protein [Mucilaginibacter rubeus]QTE54689.1 aspartyl protease family protein [Mucilaginibacter rubeus]
MTPFIHIKTSVLIFLLFSVYNTTCSAQQFSFNQGGTAKHNYYVEIPYEIINGKIFVNVVLNGKTRRFIFDTGAPVAINNKLTREINPKVLHRNKIKDVNGNADSLNFVELNDLKLGELSFSGIPAVSGIAGFYDCWNTEGVIGSNLLRNSIVSMDNQKKVLILTDNAEKVKLNEQDAIPMRLDSSGTSQSMPVIPIYLNNNIRLWLEFDTGDSDFLRFTDQTMKSIEPYDCFKVMAKGYGAMSMGLFGLEGAADKYLLKLNTLKIGDARFDQVITIPNNEGRPAIGSGILDYGNITLDYIHHKFYFKPKKKDFNMNEPQWPFQPTVQDNKLVVSLIWDNAQKLVKPGEQIINIDGKDFSTVDLCNLLINPSILAGKTSATLRVKDATGKVRMVRIQKR